MKKAEVKKRATYLVVAIGAPLKPAAHSYHAEAEPKVRLLVAESRALAPTAGLEVKPVEMAVTRDVHEQTI